MLQHLLLHVVGASLSEPHIDELNVRNPYTINPLRMFSRATVVRLSVCVSVCLSVC